MQDGVSNSWAAKARALDRYRWLLLRERHGVLGSAMRFVREALGDWWFGLRARSRLAVSVLVEPCDFLLLQSAPKVIALKRKKMLIERLRLSGYSLTETGLQKRRVILRNRLLVCPPYQVPLRYFGYAAYAEWIVEHNKPTVLLNDRNGSLYSPFLRLSLNRRGLLLVHLAHATTVESSRRLGMIDYDYYLLFGKSSEMALRRRALRYGNAVIILSGSHMIDEAFKLPVAEPCLKSILILGVGPDKEKEHSYRLGYQLVKTWAETHLDYRLLVKRHPRSKVLFWQRVANSLPNVELLESSVSLDQALEKASIVVNFMSNAVVEAGLSNRPIIYIKAGSGSDIFDQERYFGEGVDCVESLEVRIKDIERHYYDYVRRSQEFAGFHLAGGPHGLSNTIEVLGSLVRGEGVPAGVESSFLEAKL